MAGSSWGRTDTAHVPHQKREVKDRFLSEELPDGVTRGAVGTYEAEGGELYILSFSVEGSTIAGARTLSKLRCALRDDANTRFLADDATPADHVLGTAAMGDKVVEYL
ncbi:hypothetical protein [Olsenella sp. Marseille-P4559]|uniref:hypothetical protein n=1 Tax=Olsenella sp. Marseille-P4559 TaxID=2364795 RepID=UPI001030BF48|nr:hypothetical protein [Olsenella sp. Marseille-P4559]